MKQRILKLLKTVVRPSQLCPLGSNENPRWQSQLKLPGVFWQAPLEPHMSGSDAHSLLSTQKEGSHRGKTSYYSLLYADLKVDSQI